MTRPAPKTAVARMGDGQESAAVNGEARDQACDPSAIASQHAGSGGALLAVRGGAPTPSPSFLGRNGADAPGGSSAPGSGPVGVDGRATATAVNYIRRLLRRDRPALTAAEVAEARAAVRRARAERDRARFNRGPQC